MNTNSISTMACATGALAGGPVRTRFFDGMFLTQADLETEQRYWRLKRRLTNRALGAGVVWGLRLVWVPAKRIFQLSPGYALDCCGNDLVVECPTQITESELWSRADPSLLGTGFGVATSANAFTNSAINAERRDTFSACIVLQYTECGEEPRTVQGDACAVPTGTCELSRVRETARLLLVPPPVRRATPPELFLDELAELRASLPADIAGKVFPPQGSPGTGTVTGTPPVTLTVRIPGATTSDSVSFPAAGSQASGSPFSGTQNITTNTPTAVVTFELNPFSGWAFTAGRVTDQGRTVETVTPPSAPSMYWSLDIVLPLGGATPGVSTSVGFDFLVENLAVSQSFGGSQSGTVNAEIRGTVVVRRTEQGPVSVTLDQLVISTKDSSIGVGTGHPGCFDTLIPWGWTIDPANGSKIARVLVLAALYAVFEELVAAQPGFSVVATRFYDAMWMALFGADLTQDPSGQTLLKLTALLQKLFQRWCDGFIYPGPRCLDEHHGVYLGCCEIDRRGTIVSFDMYTNRRYVLTGPLLAHWAAQLGIAPIDVIVGRFADALCCIAGKPAFGTSQGNTGTAGTTGYTFSTFHTGTTGTVAAFAQQNKANVRYVGFPELLQRTFQAFTAPAGSDKEVLAMQLDGGGTVALLVPTAGTSSSGQSDLVSDVTAQLRSAGDAHVIERARPMVASFVTGVLAAAPASSLLPDNAPAASQQLAKLLDARGVTVADLATGGTALALARAGATGDATLATGADDLVDRAELAVGAVTTATAKALGTSPDKTAFQDAAKQKALVKALAAAVPKLPAAAVTTAATRAAATP